MAARAPRLQEAELAAAVTLLVERYAAAVERAAAAGATGVVGVWSGFDRWYDKTPVVQAGRRAAAVSAAAQQTAVGAAVEYLFQLLVLLGAAGASSPRPRVPQVRGGVPLWLVHTRPAEVYRRAVATGGGDLDARRLAAARAEGLTRTDVRLAVRDAERAGMEARGVTGYRRVIHPELSRSGTCGLCVAAAHRVYRVAELMPLHPPNCRCTVAPVVGGLDVGRLVNDRDLQAAYTAAGGTGAGSLSRTRFTVNEHGELGPVLGEVGQSFRGPGAARTGRPGRAGDLGRAESVLARLEAEGGDPARLAYQRRFVASLRDVA